VSQAKAWLRLAEAYDWARSDRAVPSEWTTFAQHTFQMPAKTYTPALGTALLARATDDRIDPLSIKADYSPNAYSLRTLGHAVLVPAARTMGFSIRNSGREPLNNQPFFRYDHMAAIERPRDKHGHAQFVAGVELLVDLDRHQALGALAAFLRVAIAVAQNASTYSLDDHDLTVRRVISAAETFLTGGIDIPRRTQALVAASFDLTHNDVRSRKINDPSRDYPGDVQAYVDELPILAAEARAKTVVPTEVESFVDACRLASIDRAFIIVLSPGHQKLDSDDLSRRALEGQGVLLSIVEHVGDLLRAAFIWSGLSLPDTLDRFVKSMLKRLVEIEALDSSMEFWMSTISAVSQSAEIPLKGD
jgi:hypothetical protein